MSSFRGSPVAGGAKLYLESQMGLSSGMWSSGGIGSNAGELSLPAWFLEPHWYAAYTAANHEKRVASELHARDVEYFLPLYSSVRRWKDRRVRLEMPLFPSYVFVRLALRERLRVLQIPSVVHLVGFAGRPTALPDHEMVVLRSGLSQGLCAEPHPFLTAGRRVRIKGGPFAGFEGILVRRKGKSRVVLSVDAVLRSIVVDLEAVDLEPIFQPNNPRNSDRHHTSGAIS